MASELFYFTLPPWELALRGTVIYWFLFLLFRFVLRRDAGSIGLADILVIVLIADAAQNGMAGEYKSLGDAFVLLSTIASWNYWFDWMSYRYSWFAHFAEPRVEALIRHGRVVQSNLTRNLLTLEELNSHLRQSGVTNVSEVRYAALEPDGNISVIQYNSDESSQTRPKKRVPGA